MKLEPYSCLYTTSAQIQFLKMNSLLPNSPIDNVLRTVQKIHPSLCFQFVPKNNPQSFCMSPVIGSTVRSTSTIVHCSRDGRKISDLIFIFLLLEPEQTTNVPGFPASQLASEHWALVIESGETSKLAIRFVIALCKKMKAQKLCIQNQTRKIC